MQIFKSFLVAGSLAVATSPVCLRADDTESQAMARAALQQKMRETNSQAPAAVTPLESTPPAYMPAPMDSTKAPLIAQAGPPAYIAAPQTSNPDVTEQARQATRAKMAELEGRQTNTAPVEPRAAPQPVVQPTPKTVPPPTKAKQPAVTAVKPAQPSKEEIRAAKEREAAEKKAAHEKADMEKAAMKKAAADRAAAEKAASQQAKIAAEQEKAAAKAAKPATTKGKQAKPEMAPAQFTPLQAPASNLPASKEQRLQTLLDQYRADKLTAEEYHDQRAKIIAEP